MADPGGRLARAPPPHARARPRGAPAGDREAARRPGRRDTLPEAVERRLLTHAEGNPFYLEELVRSLVETGALVRDGDGWRFDHEVEVEVPDTIEKVILARLDRLEPATSATC